MGSVKVQFLDGPHAGQTREVPTGADGAPRYDHIQALRPGPVIWEPPGPGTGTTVDRVTYRVKRSMFHTAGRTTPKWVAAIGEKVGEQVQCMQTYTHEARAGLHRFDDLIERNARHALERTCAEHGLVPAEVRKAFDGTYSLAQSIVAAPRWHDRDTDVEQAAELVARTAFPHPGRDVSFIVYTAVAMPAPEPAAEPVTAWA